MSNWHYFILTLFTIISQSLSLVAQEDTIRVQTFTWNSANRSDLFQFPAEPGQSFRKIWMKYNMRCHDAAVGNGNVGCREWDYSCNTFITDPSRTDSTRQTHPTHIISQFSGDVFDYTQTPTWSYIDYEQHQTSMILSDSSSAAIGTGGSEWLFPGSLATAKYQYLFTATELTAAGLVAGPIHALDLQTTNGGRIDFLRVRIRNTQDTALFASAPVLDGFSEVYFSSTELVPAATQRLTFYQPYLWDGSSNLVLEFSYTQTPDAEMPGVKASVSGFNSTLSSGGSDFSVQFRGAGAISVPAEKFSSVSDEITISFWMNGLPDIMPTNSTIFEGKDAGNNRQVNAHLPWGNGQVYWDCGNDGSGYDRINKPADPADYEGRWNHWAFTKNASIGEMKIYLNGTLWHSGTGFTKTIHIEEFELGSAVTGSTAYFGNIDEFRVWDRALDQSTISDWMQGSVTPDHPYHANLVAYFKLDEGSGNIVADELANGNDASMVQPVRWEQTRGKDLFRNFIADTIRPDLLFVQGTASLVDTIVLVRDSFPNAPHSVTFYDTSGSDLITTDTQLLYQAGYSYVTLENGQVVDSVWFAPQNSITIGSLTYYTKANAKYELLSLVTPYGNGLDLGDDGKTFVFDVTDYAPILTGEKRVSIEMGGEWQEELDIEFLFITGTPAREVLNIQHIWPFRRGGYADIQNDRFFEPRTIPLSPEGRYFKLRSAVTGHGQNGEFVPRTHYLNINGGDQDFTYDVWKECGDNPIYPQGGTWIFDRAGWCPGAATDVHEFDFTELVEPGESAEIDYGVNGPYMDQANYLVANQLVTYGPYTHTLDASLERIARPNNTDVEFERINPACNQPVLWIKNTGAGEITSLTIEYFVQGNEMNAQVYQWGGIIVPDQTVEVSLPVYETGFWGTTGGTSVFEASITAVNGIPDEEPANNRATSQFVPAHRLNPNFDYLLEVRTNNVGADNSYTIRNAAGDVVMERSNMQNNTTYEDQFDFAPGCYTLEFRDASDDGLQFWFFPGNGSGLLRIDKIVNIFLVPEITFISDFGKGVQFDFVVDELVGTTDETSFRSLGTYPNPVISDLTVELRGFQGEAPTILLYDVQGRPIQQLESGHVSGEIWTETLKMNSCPPGMYYVKVISGAKMYVREVVKVRE